MRRVLESAESVGKTDFVIDYMPLDPFDCLARLYDGTVTESMVSFDVAIFLAKTKQHQVRWVR